MFYNPFSPIFGGKPGVFFGRSNILSRFDLAMIDQGSDDRAFFFTGTRGSGKTALLEQLSMKAARAGRVVFDLGPDDMIAQFVHELAGFDEKTETVNPQANISILGTGGGISVGSVSKTKRAGRESLQSLLLEACLKSKKGLFVTVDEVQKVPLEDISALCNAFQMASRKGYDIMLAVAGLPYSHSHIIRHEGCTYLRRAAHEELALFTWEEADDAYKEVFPTIKGIVISQECIDSLNSSSYGHPYLMQLLGYHLLLKINQGYEEKTHIVSNDEVEKAISNALLAYENRALKPLIDELPNSERKYLSAMSACLNEDRLVLTSAVAKILNTTQNKVSKIRANLIDNGIIAAPERGYVMFCIPYLADYVKKDNEVATAVEIARKRRV